MIQSSWEEPGEPDGVHVLDEFATKTRFGSRQGRCNTVGAYERECVLIEDVTILRG